MQTRRNFLATLGFDNSLTIPGFTCITRHEG